jgi:hypothetical protein
MTRLHSAYRSEVVVTMTQAAQPNEFLRTARERSPSRLAPGDCMTRRELAEAVNAYLWNATGQKYELDAHAVARYERGVVRWPGAHYRSALRHILGADTDSALGFWPKQAATPMPEHSQSEQALHKGPWGRDRITAVADSVLGDDLGSTRRQALVAAAAVLAGSALTEPLQQWLAPLTESVPTARGSTLSTTEAEAWEQLAEQMRDWSNSANAALARKAVVAQLSDLLGRLHEVADGPPTNRAYLSASLLADTAASMSWDAGLHRMAQRYYVLAVQLAKLGADEAAAAGSLAALARQCYDLGHILDGLEVVQLAQYGTRQTATPRLSAMLATREAWAHAQRGDVQSFYRVANSAEDQFAIGTGDDEPRAVRHFDAAELYGVLGARYRDLSRHYPKQARKAQDYIGRALQLREPTRARNRAFDLIGLGRAHLVTNEPERAGELVQQAISIGRPWAAGRVGVKLRQFDEEAASFASVSEIRESRHAINQLITV